MDINKLPHSKRGQILAGRRWRCVDFDREHPPYQFIEGLARLRQANPALRRGRQVVRNYSDTPGLFAVSRIDNAS